MNTIQTYPPQGGSNAHRCPDCAGACAPEDGLGSVLRHSRTCPTGRAMDAARDRDAEWFRQHPETDTYTRELLPGDLGIGSLSCVTSSDGLPLLVTVRQLADGIRSKRLPRNVLVNLGSTDGQSVASRLGVDSVSVRCS